MKREEKNIRKVALMEFDACESAVMDKLNTLWVQTRDLDHFNVLVYPIDIMIEKVEELYPEKYINMDDFYHYTCENGSQWLISQSVNLDDIDKFYQAYLHMDELLLDEAA